MILLLSYGRLNAMEMCPIAVSENQSSLKFCVIIILFGAFNIVL